jgi:hypothetical protein
MSTWALVRYTVVKRHEPVIAGTDCGLGGRVHEEIMWAKVPAPLTLRDSG